MPSDLLARTCFVTTREDDPKKGFQRVLNKERATQIAEYIDNGLGTIPTAIILSAQPQANLTITGGKTLQFQEHPKSFLILDGQHRVYGFSLAHSNIRVPVVIYNGLSKRDESRIFIDINTKQKPVPNELLFDIKSLAEYESDTEKTLNEIFTFFHEESASPLLGLTTSSTKAPNKISRPIFYTAFKPILKVVSNREPQEVYEITSKYLMSFNKFLKKKKLSNSITKTVIFKAVCAFFPHIAQRVKTKYGGYTEEAFDEVLKPVFAEIKDSKIKNPGLSYKELSDYFIDRLNDTFTL